MFFTKILNFYQHFVLTKISVTNLFLVFTIISVFHKTSMYQNFNFCLKIIALIIFSTLPSVPFTVTSGPILVSAIVISIVTSCPTVVVCAAQSPTKTTKIYYTLFFCLKYQLDFSFCLALSATSSGICQNLTRRK